MIWPFVGFKVYGTRCFRAYETRNQSPAVKHGKTSSWCQHWTPRGDISGLHLHSHHPLTCAHTPPRISLNQQHHGRTTCKNRSLSASAAPSRSLSGPCGSLLSLSLSRKAALAGRHVVMWALPPKGLLIAQPDLIAVRTMYNQGVPTPLSTEVATNKHQRALTVLLDTSSGPRNCSRCHSFPSHLSVPRQSLGPKLPSQPNLRAKPVYGTGRIYQYKLSSYTTPRHLVSAC